MFDRKSHQLACCAYEERSIVDTQHDKVVSDGNVTITNPKLIDAYNLVGYDRWINSTDIWTHQSDSNKVQLDLTKNLMTVEKVN